MPKLTIMKKTFALTALALAVFVANGQTSTGNWLVGGSAGLTTSTEKVSGSTGVSTTNVQFTPDFGYFFVNNFAAGISLNLVSTHNSADPVSGLSYTGMLFTIGPLVRYYFYSAANVKLFVHADAAWGNEKSSFSGGGSPQNSPAIPISIYEGKAGAAFFLNPIVALEFTAGYQSLMEKYSEGGYTSKTTVGSVNIGLGFQIYLGRAKIR